MIAPLEPAIAQIIPLLPLRDPDTMAPQSARDALRALVAARTDIPPPVVQSIDEVEVMGADVRLPGRVYRVSREKSPTVVFFHGGGWVAGVPMFTDKQTISERRRNSPLPRLSQDAK
jgi:acetyl esterase